MKKIISVSMIIILFVTFLTGCNTDKDKITNEAKEYTKYTDSFFDVFDTMVQVIGYTETEEEFDSYVEKIKSRYEQLHKLYDIYNDYDGINNIKTINDNAGIKPVKVEQEIIDLITFAKDLHTRTNGQTNIAMGSVLKIWHDYRKEGEYDPENAKLPPMDQLLEAEKYTDIDRVIVDTKENTVYLEDERMRLDVGAVAKGYATEIVAKEIMKEGFTSGIISGGGNIRVLEKPPLDGVREKWGVGIQDPEKSVLPTDNRNLAVVYLNNASVVTSGDYQRFYTVDGKDYHHLIDPQTLMPGEHFRAVTVVTEDSGIADALSTAIFLTPFEAGKKLADSFGGVEVLWVMKDGTVEATEGMKKMMEK